MDQLTKGARRPSQGGFSLIEVMIALGILAFGLLTMSGMQIHAMRGGASGRQSSQAAAFAQDKMEEFQRAAWSTLAETSGWTSGVTETPAQGNQDYTVSWRIADLVANATKSIDVRVAWSEPRRPNRSLTISSYRFNREGS
jgi:prepilin-type N-terminal cleavage/methylation domain-containing protein